MAGDLLPAAHKDQAKEIVGVHDHTQSQIQPAGRRRGGERERESRVSRQNFIFFEYRFGHFPLGGTGSQGLTQSKRCWKM